MTPLKLVSIVIPVYNTGKFLRKCIDSILEQTYQNFEIILINDGSTDNSLELCNKYCENDRRMKVITIKNSGPSAARNVGIDHTTGEFLLFIDSDDYLESRMIEALVNSIGDEDQLAMCGFYSIDKHKKVNHSPDAGHFNLNYILNNFGSLYENYFMQFLWNKIYRTEVIKNNSIKFDITTKRGEDLLFNLDYLKNCNTVRFIDDPLYNHINYNEDSLTKKFNETLFRDQQNLFNEIRNFLNSYDAYPVNKKLIEKLYMDRITGCFPNLFSSDATISKGNLKKEILKIISDKNVRSNLVFLKRPGIQWRLLKLMIQIRSVTGIYFLFRFRDVIKKNVLKNN